MRATSMQHDMLALRMEELGPHIGVAVLQAEFVDVAKREVLHLAAQIREQKRNVGKETHKLAWLKPGRVWAMDHTEHRDGGLVLAVRDLASNYTMLWDRALTRSAEDTVQWLDFLFTKHGAPLVIKSDNGGLLKNAAVKKLLVKYGVLPLYSPAYCPQYNGAIEASMTYAKKRTEFHAEVAGHKGWQGDDLRAARQQANECTRPWGYNKPTPADVWKTRVAVKSSEREELKTSWLRHRADLIAERELDDEACEKKTMSERLDRAALRRALEELGLLLVLRRRIYPPIRTRRTARLS